MCVYIESEGSLGMKEGDEHGQVRKLRDLLLVHGEIE